MHSAALHRKQWMNKHFGCVLLILLSHIILSNLSIPFIFNFCLLFLMLCNAVKLTFCVQNIIQMNNDR